LSETIYQALRELEKHFLLPVIKLGEKGACSISKKEIISQPGYKVRNIDTTGAGDSFNAGFLFAYLQENDIKDCLRWGCACGALSTLYPGGIEGQPTRVDVENFLSNQAEKQDR
jgi:sugar/nucleoside kinase (ribokinase family)